MNFEDHLLEVPEEVLDAARVLESWTAKQGMDYWEIGAVCSRRYAFAVHDYVPKLRKIHDHSCGPYVVQAHNSAVKKLRELGHNE